MLQRDMQVVKGTLPAPVESALTKKKKDKEEIQADPKSGFRISQEAPGNANLPQNQRICVLSTLEIKTSVT